MAGNQDYKEVPQRLGYFTYRCKNCGQECVEKSGLPSGLPTTKKGNYGSSGTPTPSAYNDILYTASTISFTAATATEPAMINDSALMFAEKHFTTEMVVKIVTGSGTNDKTVTIASRGVAPGVLSLSSSDTLSTESAATAGEVSLYRVIYQPNVSGGCGFCGSLNSR